jgi:DNA-binding protein HU-beta
MNQLIGTSAYQNATSEQKAKMINDIMSGSRAVAKQSFGSTSKLASAGKAVANGILPSLTTTGKVTTGSSTVLAPGLDANSASILKQYGSMSAADRSKALMASNDAKFKFDQAKYNNDKANGKINPVQDINRRAALAKEQIGANFNPTVRSLYGLSKSKLATYLSQNPNSQDTVNQLLAYDKALVDAGITSKSKYATGVTSSSRSSSTRTTRASSVRSVSTRTSRSGVTRTRSSTGRVASTSAATKSAVNALNSATKSSISSTSAFNKKVTSAKVSGAKAHLPSGKAKGVKIAAFKKVSAAPKISMKRRT